MKKLPILFWELFKISLFVIGGGYSILVVADAVFSRKGWTKEDELLEHLPIFQMVPGLIATHTAVFVGGRVAGPLGAALGVVAVALPSIAIFTVVAQCYQSLPLENPWLDSAFVGLRSALTGIIAATVIRSWCKFLTDAFAYSILVLAVLALVFVEAPIVAVLVTAMALGVASKCVQDGKIRFRSPAWLGLLCFLQYGVLCFGGGFVLVPMYLRDFIGASAPFLQLPEEEFSNIMALSQMTPGPIGVNCATFFGYRMAGVPGAVAASALLLLPGSVALWFVLRSLERFKTSRIVGGIMRGIRPASVAMMIVALFAFAKMAVFSDSTFNTIAAILVVATTYATMKKKINPILLIILSAVAACAVRADDITCERFPDADSVAIEEIERVEYNPDGTSTMRQETVTRILTERGRRDESVVSFSFNARYSKMSVTYVGIKTGDEAEREIDVSGTTKEASDNSSLASNIVDPMDRSVVCTIPGLKVGDLLRVKLERTTFKSRIKDSWSDISLFEWSHPILKSVYEVKSPKERPIRSRKICHSLGNLTERIVPQSDGSTLYVYTATNSPRMFPEPSMPPQWTQVESVRLSTAADWRELSRWYWDLSVPHLAKVTPAISNKVESLGRDANRIYKFVSQEVRYMGLTMEEVSPGYAPHDVNITFDNRYGVCRDKAGLLVAMLRTAGHKAFPVLINVGAKMDPDVPEPYFNHAIVAIEGEKSGEYTLMDPTDENAKEPFPAYLGNCSYLVARPEGETLKTSPVMPAESNSVNVVTVGKLAKDGTMAIESDIDFLGINDTVYRHALVKARPEERERIIRNRLNVVEPGSDLVRCDITPADLRDTSKPLHVRLVARIPETILKGECEDVLTVPFLTKSFNLVEWLLGGNTALEKRRYTLVMDSTARVCENITVDLGASLGEVKRLPDTVSITGACRYARSFAVSNGVLTASREHAVGEIEISPASYAALRESVKQIEAAERQKLAFDAHGNKGANVCTILDSCEADIASDKEWTITNTVVKEVLTYRGKKDSAELKFSFNPTWKSVKLVSATVSNLSGVVHSVKPVEMNVVDCGWAAAAPRYPAGKILVVGLPSVEIGSVISATVEATITNAPAPFAREWLFDSRDPKLRQRLRIGNYVRDERSVKRVESEPCQPPDWMWRDMYAYVSGGFASVAPALLLAADVDACEVEDEDSIEGLRNWMAKNVRVVGPSLYEMPLANQLTDPATVIAERYATRLDYVRTLCAILKGAGYDADIVFAADDAGMSEAGRHRMMHERENVRAFSSALCRVRITEGGLFGLFGTERVLYLGTENEYTPLETSAFEGCDFFDPKTGEFGIVEVSDGKYRSSADEDVTILVRENGTVDYIRGVKLYGHGVGAFRKRYAEILPEDFSRHYQTLLGMVSQGAVATRELTPDIESYPAELHFECMVPDYATVADGTASITLPEFTSPLPSLDGTVRTTPIAIGSAKHTSETVKIVFPDGYDTVEYLPQSFELRDPLAPEKVWMTSSVTTTNENGRLAVTIRRENPARRRSVYGCEFAEAFREWNRRSNTRSSRTIVIRKGKD